MSEHLSVSEMARYIWGRHFDRHWIMTDIRAAFDSSKDDPSGVTVVAGYVGAVDTWESIEGRWNNQLGIAHLASFRLSEIKQKYRDLAEAVRPFAKIAGESGLRSITASLKDEDWALLDHDSAYRKLCPHREHACLDILFGALAEDVGSHFGDGRVCVVFDNDWGNRDAIVRIHDAWAERTGHPRFDIFLKGDRPWDTIPLQCSDMIAGLVRQDPFWHARLDSEPFGDESDPLTSVTSLALSNGRSAMWSAPIAADVEEILRKRRRREEGG